MLKNQEEGLLLEKKLNKQLHNLDIFDKIFRETELIVCYGKTNVGIDNTIFINNFVITIQDKWKSGNQKIATLSNFMLATDRIIKKTKEKSINKK
jgi:hypothetical protein